MAPSSALEMIDFSSKSSMCGRALLLECEILPQRWKYFEPHERLEIESYYYLGTEGTIVPLVAVDASSSIVGMSDEQLVEAVRAAIVLKLPKENPRVIRLGPYLRSYSSPKDDGMVALEMLAKKFALSQVTKGIVLLDGLTLYEERQATQQIYDQFFNGNTIISIVKRFMSTKILPKSIERDKLIVAKLKNTPLYLLKLGKEPIILKSEIYPPMEIEDVAHAVNNLLKSDSIYMAYPNTLRLSHIYSKILFSESVALRKLAMCESSIVLYPIINERKVILGPIWS